MQMKLDAAPYHKNPMNLRVCSYRLLLLNSVLLYCSLVSGQAPRNEVTPSAAPITYQMVFGTTYYLLVQRSSNSNAFFDLTLSSVPSTINEHDYCVNAIPLAIGSSVIANTTFVMSDETQMDQDCVPTNAENITLYLLGLWVPHCGYGWSLDSQGQDCRTISRQFPFRLSRFLWKSYPNVCCRWL
jgi:hypothetical protein